MSKLKIGVYGSAGGEEVAQAVGQAKAVGRELAKNNCIVITGACPGLPYAAAVSTKQHGGEVWGFSPCQNLKEHSKLFSDDDPSVYKKMFFIPKSFRFAKNLEVTRKYRNVVSTAHADAGIIMAGRWGTMHEFCSLHDYGKVIGVLTGTGGIADELPKLMKKISKQSKAKIIFNRNPQTLVGLVTQELKYRGP